MYKTPSEGQESHNELAETKISRVGVVPQAKFVWERSAKNFFNPFLMADIVLRNPLFIRPSSNPLEKFLAIFSFLSLML